MKLDTKSGKIAFSSIFTALAVSVMFAGSILPLAEYSVVAVSGLFLVPVVIEIGRGHAVIAYTAASLLALIIVPNKEVAMLFALFFGIYPILKSVFESFNRKLPEYVLKFVFFNVTMIAAFFISVTVLKIPKEEYSLFGVYIPWLFLLIGNVVFILYDICLTQMITLYVNVVREKILRRL